MNRIFMLLYKPVKKNQARAFSSPEPVVAVASPLIIERLVQHHWWRPLLMALIGLFVFSFDFLIWKTHFWAWVSVLLWWPMVRFSFRYHTFKTEIQGAYLCQIRQNYFHQVLTRIALRDIRALEIERKITPKKIITN
ncbi:MAG: hypothetical protein HC913_01090 [Microscillaceae bacterium]|nr:hypothetical protein [Microscillaceae bacterium]